MVESCALALIKAFAAHGVDTAFGIPGVHTLELYRAIGKSGLRHVATRHEQGAAFMADGYARASGRPALCVLITGPGLLNAATAIGQAYSDSVPMVVLSTVNARTDLGLGRGMLHEMRNQLQSMEGLVGSALRVNDPQQTKAIAELSLARLKLGRSRPVYIEMPLDVAPAEVDIPASTVPELFPPCAHPDALARAAELLRGARRPLMIIGGGAVHAATEAQALCRQLGMPAIATIAGKGIVPDDCDHSLGARLGSAVAQRLIGEADVVIAVGTELANPDHWQKLLPIKGALIRVDLDPDVMMRDYTPTVPLLGDARQALASIGSALAGPERAAWAGDLAALRDEADAGLRERRPAHLTLLAELRATLADDAIVVTDMTQIAYAGNIAFPARQPRTWFHPVGFGTLGYALPAAIGAKVARPEQQVVALAGDYGFGFTVQELGTAADLGLSLPVIIWNNRGLGQIQQDMDLSGIGRIAVDIEPPAFDNLAAAYGCGYAAVEDLSDLRAVLTAALGAGRPTVIEVKAP